MSTDTFTILTSILVDLGIPPDTIHEKALLRKDLGIDSTETVEIAIEVRRRLGVNIRLEARQDMPLADVCAMIDEALAVRVAAS